MIEQLKTADLAEVFQRSMKDFVRVLEENPRLDGRAISVTIVAGTPLVIDHLLGRQPLGWEITDLTFAGAAALQIRRTAWDERSITLETVGVIGPADVGVGLWVY